MFSRAVLVESIASLAISLVLLFLLPLEHFFSAFIVLGYAHFALAYWYQWKAGKLTGWFLLMLGLYATGIAAFVMSAPINWQVAVTGICFAAHHFFDEIRLLGFTTSPRRLLELGTSACAFIALYTASVFGAAFGGVTIFFVAALAYASGVAVFTFLRRRDCRFDFFTGYMLASAALFGALFVGKAELIPGVLIGVLVLYHYFKWYGYVYRKTPEGSRARSMYVRDACLVSLACVGLYAASLALPDTMLAYIFTPSPFYFMAIVHIVSSFMQQSLFPQRPSYARLPA